MDLQEKIAAAKYSEQPRDVMAQRLRVAMALAGKDTGTLSKAIGAHRKTVAEWVSTSGNCDRRARFAMMLAAADALGVSPDALCDPEPFDTTTAPVLPVLPDVGGHIKEHGDVFRLRLRVALAASGVTLQQIQREQGVSRYAADRWLSGKVVPRIDGLVKFCRATGANIAWIFLTDPVEMK